MTTLVGVIQRASVVAFKVFGGMRTYHLNHRAGPCLIPHEPRSSRAVACIPAFTAMWFLFASWLVCYRFALSVPSPLQRLQEPDDCWCRYREPATLRILVMAVKGSNGIEEQIRNKKNQLMSVHHKRAYHKLGYCGDRGNEH